MSSLNIPIEIASFLASLATTIGVPIALCQMRQYAKERREVDDAERKKRTLDYYQNRLHDQLIEYDKQLDTFELFGGRFGAKPVPGNLIASNKNAESLVRQYLIVLEPFAAGINTGIYDLNMFDRLYGENLLLQKKAVWDYIHFERKRWGFSQLYREYELMVSSLEVVHEVETHVLQPNVKAALPGFGQ